MLTAPLAASVIIGILRQQMQLSANQVWLRQQNKTIPNDENLYIAVGLNSAQTIANITEMVTMIDPDTEEPAQYELNQIQQKESIQIDIFSSAKSQNPAILRNWEVVAALQSFYSQQQQEANYFKIFRIPQNFVDTSSAEGGSMIQRYTITIVCFTWYRKTTLLGDYYDDFTVQAGDEANLDEIDFEITPETPPPPFL